MRKFLMYLTRWQLSTPILAIVVNLTIEKCGSLVSTIIANLIGGIIFYKVDKFIFNKKSDENTESKTQ